MISPFRTVEEGTGKNPSTYFCGRHRQDPRTNRGYGIFLHFCDMYCILTRIYSNFDFLGKRSFSAVKTAVHCMGGYGILVNYVSSTYFEGSVENRDFFF